MYKRPISLFEPEQVSLGEPEHERVYPDGDTFLKPTTGANPHYP